MNYSGLLTLRIKQLCDKYSITINKLAVMSGLKQSTVNNILCGASKNPKLYTLHRIATTFNMTLSEFLDFDELNNYFPEDDEYE